MSIVFENTQSNITQISTLSMSVIQSELRLRRFSIEQFFIEHNEDNNEDNDDDLNNLIVDE